MEKREEARYTVDEWNRRFRIGQDVVVKEDFKPKGTVTKTKSEARVMCGDAVIWCEGISGAYSLSCVVPI